MTAILKKEMKSYFTSVNGYVFVGFFLLITAFYFGIYNVDGQSPYYANTMSSTIIMFLILIPVSTMRLFAEEARQKTDQLLYTSPLSVSQIVIGKFLASFFLFTLSLTITLLFPFILSQYGEVPWVETLGSYFGFLLLGACFISIGIFISSLTESQVVAAVACFAALFLFFIVDAVAASMPIDRLSSMIFIAVVIAGISYLLYDSTKNLIIAAGFAFFCIAAATIAYLINNILFDGVIYNVLIWFSVLSRFSNFYAGIINVSDVVYYLTFSTVFVFLTVNTIEKRRWK